MSADMDFFDYIITQLGILLNIVERVYEIAAIRPYFCCVCVCLCVSVVGRAV